MIENKYTKYKGNLYLEMGLEIVKQAPIHVCMEKTKYPLI